MRYSHSLPRILTSVFFVAQAFSTTVAFAAGYQINEFSPGLQGAALAGAAAADNDSSAMYVNPATLSTIIKRQAYIGVNEILPQISVSQARATHSVIIPGLPPTVITAPVNGRTSQGNITNNILVPDGSLSWRINDKLVAGLTVISPFGLETKYYNSSVLRFAALYSSVQTIAINPALAYNLNNQLAVGAGFVAQYVKATFSNFNGIHTGFPPFDAVLGTTHPTHLKADGWGYGYTLGVLYKPDLVTRIGLGYRSAISEQISGFGQQYIVHGNTTTPPPAIPSLFNAQTAVHAGIKTPAALTLSAARDINNWTLKASAQLNFWSTFDHLSIYMPSAFVTNSTIQTKWSNAWFAALGADYRFSSPWIVRGGLAYDQTPTTGYRDPRIPDTDRFWATIGASYLFNKQLSLDGVYEHIFMVNQKVNVTQTSGTTPFFPAPLETNTVHAKYQASVNIVGLALRYNF